MVEYNFNVPISRNDLALFRLVHNDLSCRHFFLCLLLPLLNQYAMCHETILLYQNNSFIGLACQRSLLDLLFLLAYCVTRSSHSWCLLSNVTRLMSSWILRSYHKTTDGIKHSSGVIWSRTRGRHFGIANFFIVSSFLSFIMVYGQPLFERPLKLEDDEIEKSYFRQKRL